MSEFVDSSVAKGKLARSISWLNHRRELLIVLAVALVARVGYWVLVTPRYVPESDAAQYQDLARYILRGEGYSQLFPQLYPHPTAFRPPGYSYMLAGAIKVFGDNVVSGRILSLVFGLMTVALVYLLTRHLAPGRAAFFAALAVALYPPLIVNDTMLLTESLSLALIAGLMLALVCRRWPTAAVLCGLLILTRASAQYVVVPLALWVLWRLGWRRALGFLAIALAVVSPWIIRNQIQLGSPVYVTSNGFNLAGTYSPASRQERRFVDPVFDDRFEQFRLAQFNEADWADQLQAFAFEDIRTHPGQVPGVVWRNALHLFEFTPQFNEWAENADGRNLDFRSATLWLFYPVTIIGLFGLFIRRRSPDVLLVIGVGAYFVLGSLALLSPPRLRSPFDLCCCIGVGLAAQWWMVRRGTGREAPA